MNGRIDPAHRGANGRDTRNLGIFAHGKQSSLFDRFGETVIMPAQVRYSRTPIFAFANTVVGIFVSVE